MKTNPSQSKIILIKGKPHVKQMLLADVNFPYKLTIDRKNNNLFFCINADEFSDQSFQSVMLNCDTGFVSIIPGIRNGFASAVNQSTGDVYFGGSDGIFKYNNNTNDIDQHPLISGVDIFDMSYNEDNLYFVDTCNQSLQYICKDRKKCLVSNLKDTQVEHFVFDVKNDLYFVNHFGVFVLKKGSKSPALLDQNIINIRGATTDVYGSPFFVAKDGIYEIDKESRQLSKILSLENGNGLAFNKDNNIIYSEERSVVALIPD